MTIHQLAKALPQSMESVARSALLSHFSDQERELTSIHDTLMKTRGEHSTLKNRVDTLQAQVDGLLEYFEAKISLLTDWQQVHDEKTKIDAPSAPTEVHQMTIDSLAESIKDLNEKFARLAAWQADHWYTHEKSTS